MTKTLSLPLFLFAVMGGGLAIGILTAPGEWYATLQKPTFNPPNWVFGPVWTVLYLIIAYVGWRLWQRDPHGLMMRLWFAQMILNFLWSPVFFAAQKPGIALLNISLLFLTIALFIGVSWRFDRQAALLFAPYVLWLGFALTLNAAIVYLN